MVLEGARISSLWETEPVEVEDEQPSFLNLCLAGETEASARSLLELCGRLESEAGRKSGHRQPRLLDVDLLLLGQERVEEPDLVLPHPGLPRRRFVLAPLAEILPDWVHPETGAKVTQMLKQLGESQVIRLRKAPKDWWND